MSVTIPSSDVQGGKYHSASPQFSGGSPQSHQGPSSERHSMHPFQSHVALPSAADATALQAKTELTSQQVQDTTADQENMLSGVIAPSSLNHAPPSIVSLQSQAAQKPQVVLLVKKEEKSQDDRLSRKRPRSASLDMALNVSQGSMMPPPAKKVC